MGVLYVMCLYYGAVHAACLYAMRMHLLVSEKRLDAIVPHAVLPEEELPSVDRHQLWQKPARRVDLGLQVS
jgi:hypothetical protein